MKTTLSIRISILIFLSGWYTFSNAQLSVKRSFDKQTKELTVTLCNQYNDKKLRIIQPYSTENLTSFYIFIINDEFRRDSRMLNAEIYPNLSNKPIILRFNCEKNFLINPGCTYSVKFDLKEIPDKKGLKEIGSFGQIYYCILSNEGNPIKDDLLKIQREYFDYY